MSAGVFDGRLEQAKQDFLNVLRTAESKEDIDHHRLGVSATTITRMFDRDAQKYLDWEGRTKETLHSHLSENEKLAGEADQITDDLFKNIEKISAHVFDINSLQINKKINGGIAAFCFAASIGFAGGSANQHADITNESEVAKTSPGLYLQNRLELSEKFARECMFERLEEQKVQQEYSGFVNDVVEKPFQNASVTLNYDASGSEEALKGCMEGPKIEEHVSSIEKNRFNANALAVGSGVMLALGVANMYRRREDIREIENSEREIVSLKTNSFSPVVN